MPITLSKIWTQADISLVGNHYTSGISTLVNIENHFIAITKKTTLTRFVKTF